MSESFSVSTSSRKLLNIAQYATVYVHCETKKSFTHTSKAIVLNAVSDSELNQFIKQFRTIGVERPLFAVVTETSINWKFHDLIDDLIEEKKMFDKMRKQNKNK